MPPNMTENVLILGQINDMGYDNRNTKIAELKALPLHQLSGGSGDLDPSHCPFEPEEDLQNDLLYDIFVEIVAGIMRDRSAALQWPEQGLDHNNGDHREFKFAFTLVTHAYAEIQYALQLLTAPPPNPSSSDRGAKETKQTVSLWWHEFSATARTIKGMSNLSCEDVEGKDARHLTQMLCRFGY